ncbi:hypothetical protein ACFOET_17830 [Parapedobacter deserti]|uniref:Uncharacterized protein n=1 Tax=Parapedobacter deserti TaxID=1912957 RepID=A0ABV7JQN4_9SPHI
MNLKSIVVVMFLTVAAVTVCFAQGSTFPTNGGNVGIGTTSPSDLLHLNIGANRKGITLRSDGNNAAYADINFIVANDAGIQQGTPVQWIISHRKDGYFSDNPTGQTSLEFYGTKKGGGYIAPLVFKSDGNVILVSSKSAAAANVLIGKTTQQNATYKLDVNGKIRANEITVNTTGADFVFDPDYNLLPLSEVEAHINTHRHLHDIPPASDMQRDGVGLGDISTKMLQKIEELMLYTIEQQKQIHRLEKEIENLKRDRQ